MSRLLAACAALFILIHLALAFSLRRAVPESRRYALPHADRPALPGRRFLLLGVSAFLYNILVAPTTFYENRYLKDVRGYSASLYRRSP